MGASNSGRFSAIHVDEMTELSRLLSKDFPFLAVHFLETRAGCCLVKFH